MQEDDLQPLANEAGSSTLTPRGTYRSQRTARLGPALWYASQSPYFQTILQHNNIPVSGALNAPLRSGSFKLRWAPESGHAYSP
ncbi:hypothetical protein PsYK624_101180 [Phanerochaete sordida]|uniref:Uncharacterized protein n=1 Tax=Phanerochaete sordida TaxID=48140 RepID=A0A9P3GE02_9APHY|nr:hypothetical protein PsYK624_101180 [Phanerochaete sordida]